MSQEPSAAQKLIGDFAPKLVDLTDRVLFCDVWERPELSKRDRSLATVSADCYESARSVAVSAWQGARKWG